MMNLTLGQAKTNSWVWTSFTDLVTNHFVIERDLSCHCIDCWHLSPILAIFTRLTGLFDDQYINCLEIIIISNLSGKINKKKMTVSKNLQWKYIFHVWQVWIKLSQGGPAGPEQPRKMSRQELSLLLRDFQLILFLHFVDHLFEAVWWCCKKF